MSIVRNYLVSANTSAGYVTFFNEIINDSERIYILKGGPGSGKSTFIKKIGYDLLDHGYDIDFIYSPSDTNSLDGLFINDIKVLIVDGSMPNIIEPKYPGAVERVLNFNDFWDIDYLRKNKDIIKYYFDELSSEYEVLYQQLKEAKLTHDKLEIEYMLGMDFKKADKTAEELINKIITDKLDKVPVIHHRFAGAMVPGGQLCFYRNLTSNLKNKLVIKGRAGTGKSTLLKKVGKAAELNGYDVEYYLCAFDPDSLDGVIIPELGYAILDGTAPHVIDPEKNDELIDMFECINTNTVQEKDDPIKAIQAKYSEEIAKAAKIYFRIHDVENEIKKFYKEATDFNEVDALRIRITNALKELKK